jgi:hypothetical protein
MAGEVQMARRGADDGIGVEAMFTGVPGVCPRNRIELAPPSMVVDDGEAANLAPADRSPAEDPLGIQRGGTNVQYAAYHRQHLDAPRMPFGAVPFGPLMKVRHALGLDGEFDFSQADFSKANLQEVSKLLDNAERFANFFLNGATAAAYLFEIHAVRGYMHMYQANADKNPAQLIGAMTSFEKAAGVAPAVVRKRYERLATDALEASLQMQRDLRRNAP